MWVVATALTESLPDKYRFFRLDHFFRFWRGRMSVGDPIYWQPYVVSNPLKAYLVKPIEIPLAKLVLVRVTSDGLVRKLFVFVTADHSYAFVFYRWQRLVDALRALEVRVVVEESDDAA